MAIKNKQIKKAAEFLYEIGTLRKVVRAHRQSLLTDDLSDNIASHSFRVAWIGWLLAKEERADSNKVMLMCLAHDITEARSGDQNWVHKRYVKVFNEELVKDQIKDLPGEKELVNILDEYEERKTKEAKIAKDADLIDQILLIKEYIWQGNKEAELWLKKGKGSSPNTHLKMLKTLSAKKIARRIINQKPGDWWKDIWTEKRR